MNEATSPKLGRYILVSIFLNFVWFPVQKRPRISACNRKRLRALRKSPRIYRPRTLGTYVTYICVRKCTTCVYVRTHAYVRLPARDVRNLRTCGSRSRCAYAYVWYVRLPIDNLSRLTVSLVTQFALHYLTFCLSIQVIDHKTKTIITLPLYFCTIMKE